MTYATNKRSAVEELQPRIDEVFDFFTAFGSGAYLGQEDDSWDPTMNVSLLPELRASLEKLLVRLEAAAGENPAEPAAVIAELLGQFYSEVEALNERAGETPVVEVEEMEDLRGIIDEAIALVGFGAIDVDTLPQWQDGIDEEGEPERG